MTEALGDPLFGVTATWPGLMPTSPAPVTAVPLQDAIGMWPLRSASPWKEGSLLFRTQDGKIMPFAPTSSEQAAWIDFGVTPMGGGKSVFLNAFNFAFVTQAGLSRLPWLSIVDVGPSSSGLIALLQSSSWGIAQIRSRKSRSTNKYFLTALSDAVRTLSAYFSIESKLTLIL